MFLSSPQTQWPAWYRAQNTYSIKACQCRPLIKPGEPKTLVFKPSPLPSLLHHQPDSTVTIPSTEWFHFLIFELGLPHTNFSSPHLCSCSWLRGEALPFFSLIAIFQPLPPSLSAVRGTSLTSLNLIAAFSQRCRPLPGLSRAPGSLHQILLGSSSSSLPSPSSC